MIFGAFERTFDEKEQKIKSFIIKRKAEKNTWRK